MKLLTREIWIAMRGGKIGFCALLVAIADSLAKPFIRLQHPLPINASQNKMPKLANQYRKPRIEAFDICIKALEVAYEDPKISFAQHEQYRFMLKKLRREKNAFEEKYSIDERTCGRCHRGFVGFEHQEGELCPDCHHFCSKTEENVNLQCCTPEGAGQ